MTSSPDGVEACLWTRRPRDSTLVASAPAPLQCVRSIMGTVAGSLCASQLHCHQSGDLDRVAHRTCSNTRPLGRSPTVLWRPPSSPLSPCCTERRESGPDSPLAASSWDLLTLLPLKPGAHGPREELAVHRSPAQPALAQRPCRPWSAFLSAGCPLPPAPSLSSQSAFVTRFTVPVLTHVATEHRRPFQGF